ncbi:hypothetical protein GCM10010172_71480 [Paractinoplanes ferrugineus]|uniref:Glycolipid-binding domain-containing protein n=1 Tax=Paractinoplanes ferrugineus TaxID=113564 RepID=A0A919MGP7_9ACTN|nr:putative glycolipid-binding domain-containing protein [Actinoplanes ferrugineus]GIE15033.1 hypothetical protein Afe05nite_68730 [Actinoplanes ferrugineus]
MNLGTASTQRRVAASRAHGPLVWQRTGTIGTELVLRDSVMPGVVTGASIVGGSRPYSARWHADLDGSWRIRTLTITTEGSGWRRNLALSRTPDGAWTCGAEQSGDVDAPPPGIDDPARLDDASLPLVSESPIFLTWALRALRLDPATTATAAPTIRIRMPWLMVVPGVSTFQRISENRLRVTGDGPASAYDLDAEGIVTYQAGRLRIAP